MKNLLIILAILFLASCTDKPVYNIQGVVDADFEGKVYLKKQVGYLLETIDSVEVKDNAFEFNGTIELPDMYGITLEGKEGVKRFCLENSDYQFKITDRVAESEVLGGEYQPKINSFMAEMAKMDEEERSMIIRLRKVWKNESATDQDKKTIDIELKKLRNNKLMFAKNYVHNNTNNPHAPIVIDMYIRNFLTLDQLDSVYQTFTTDVKKSDFGSIIGQSIVNTRLSAVGEPFLDFSVPGVDGKMIKLSEVVKNNKLVFIDFWASWCSPCKATIPHLKKLYSEYHPLGLEILAVSYDDNKEKWLKAIEDEELTWLNGSNLKGWGCPTSHQYALRGIPATILISNDGKIIARNLKIEELNEKISEILKEK